MKKIILCSILAITIFSSIGCSVNQTALNDKVDKKENNDTKISFKPKQETKDKIDTYVSAERTWAYDVTNPETILENTDYLVKVQVKTKEKTKTDKLSKKDLQKLVMISNESYYELAQGNEYYICIRNLTQDENYKGYYGMPEGGYDVFQEKNGLYVNVLTQETFIR